MPPRILGIDFGTTYSSMAMLDGDSGRAVVLRNQEGEEKTPSIVCFGEDGTEVVGRPAVDSLDVDEAAWAWAFLTPKRHLGDVDFVRGLPDGRVVTAVDATAAILRKLREDAEVGDLGGPADTVVLTCPASFGPTARDALREAAALAGLGDVRLLEEPVAAGLAGLRDQGARLGETILVYDLGGGTFDVAVLRRDGSGHRLVGEPRGIERCGGEDFDRAIYDWFDGLVLAKRGQSFDGEDGLLNPPILRACRLAKEMLSKKAEVPLRGILDRKRFEELLTRVQLEELIGEQIAATVRLSQDVAAAAAHRGHAVESVLLIGGSSRIPLVWESLKQELTQPRGMADPLRLGATDFAVVTGAVYFAVPPPSPPPPLPRWEVGMVFRDREEPWCPEMVVLPRGSFQMGSPDSEPERYSDAEPRHPVMIGYDLAMGTCAVSFAEWDAYALATGCYRPGDEGWGRGDRPVINVSWYDVQGYLVWLNEGLGLTGRPDCYRLPSEAEWEYGCRGGTETPFWWGRSITPTQANYDGNFVYDGGGSKGEYRARTLPVRSFEPNPFGLYQVHGNIYEWCQDYWKSNYQDAPRDGSAVTGNNSCDRVCRGGSCGAFPRWLRSASRNRFAPGDRHLILGFRLARTLP